MIGEDDFTAWMRSNEMDRISAYLQRGRFYSSLSDEVLTDRWILAAREMCLDAVSPGKRQIECDLKAELDLRGIAAPFDAIEAELLVLHQRFAEGIERLRQESPTELARVDAELTELVEDFQHRKGASQH